MCHNEQKRQRRKRKHTLALILLFFLLLGVVIVLAVLPPSFALRMSDHLVEFEETDDIDWVENARERFSRASRDEEFINASSGSFEEKKRKEKR